MFLSDLMYEPVVELYGISHPLTWVDQQFQAQVQHD